MNIKGNHSDDEQGREPVHESHRKYEQHVQQRQYASHTQQVHQAYRIPQPIHEITDEMLLHAVANGTEWALDALYQRYGRLLYSLAYRMVTNQQIAEDLTQEAFVSVWRRANSYSSQAGTARTWLFTIMRNRVIDYLRSVRRQTENMPEAPWEDAEREEPLAEADTADEAWQSIQSQNVRTALMRLPAEQRFVIELAYFQGYSQNEIATNHHIALGTVKARIRLGIQRLKRILAEMGIDEQ